MSSLYKSGDKAELSLLTAAIFCVSVENIDWFSKYYYRLPPHRPRSPQVLGAWYRKRRRYTRRVPAARHFASTVDYVEALMPLLIAQQHLIADLDPHIDMPSLRQVALDVVTSVSFRI